MEPGIDPLLGIEKNLMVIKSDFEIRTPNGYLNKTGICDYILTTWAKTGANINFIFASFLNERVEGLTQSDPMRDDNITLVESFELASEISYRLGKTPKPVIVFMNTLIEYLGYIPDQIPLIMSRLITKFRQKSYYLAYFEDSPNITRDLCLVYNIPYFEMFYGISAGGVYGLNVFNENQEYVFDIKEAYNFARTLVSPNKEHNINGLEYIYRFLLHKEIPEITAATYIIETLYLSGVIEIKYEELMQLITTLESEVQAKLQRNYPQLNLQEI